MDDREPNQHPPPRVDVEFDEGPEGRVDGIDHYRNVADSREAEVGSAMRPSSSSDPEANEERLAIEEAIKERKLTHSQRFVLRSVSLSPGKSSRVQSVRMFAQIVHLYQECLAIIQVCQKWQQRNLRSLLRKAPSCQNFVTKTASQPFV